MMKRWSGLVILAGILMLPASALSFVPQLPEVVIESVGRQYSNLFTIPRLADRRLLQQLFYPAQSGLADCCIVDRVVWYEGEWGKSFLKSDCSGFDLKTVGAIAGTQRYRRQNWLTGVAVAAQHNHLFRNRLRGNEWAFQGAFYTLYTDPCYYIFSDLALGFGRFSLDRRVQIGFFEGRAHSKPHIFHGAWYGEVGTSFYFVDALYIQPFIGVQTGFYHLDGFGERGERLIAVSLPSQTQYTLDSRLGFHLSTLLPVCFVFNLDLAWRHSFKSVTEQVTTRSKRTGRVFYLNGVKIGSNGIEGSVSLIQRISSLFRLFAKGSYEQWHKFESYALELGVIGAW